MKPSLTFLSAHHPKRGVAQATPESSLLRGGQPQMLPSEHVVPGDVVVLAAGSLIPADGILLEANDFFVNQEVLTGETFPVEKKPATVPVNASLAERTNCVFMVTSAGSKTAQVLIVQTGKTTVFGQVAERLRLRPAETEFERLADLLSEQPAEVRELFRYVLVLAMIDDEKAQVTGTRMDGDREYLTVQTIAGEVFEIIRPPISEEVEAQLMEQLRAIIADEQVDVS